MAVESHGSSRFLKACRCEQVDCTPVWIMHQTGRYLKEYKEIRKKVSFVDLCRTPELACEVSLLPINRFDLDAAIVFSDLLVSVEGTGVSVDIIENIGPVIRNPIRDRAAVEKLSRINPEEDVASVLETIQLINKELGGRLPVIGFSGAPFTLASYLVEGQHSRHYAYIKSLMLDEPKVYDMLMSKLSHVIGACLNAQIEAGAHAVQVFDTWAGYLSPGDYRQFALPYARRAIEQIADKSVPVIYYMSGNSAILNLMNELGVDVIGIDWRMELDAAWEKLGKDLGIQGNLDPVVLLAKPAEIERRAKDIIRRANNRPGHIFNLGRGILPQTPVENVQVLVEAVHEYSTR